MKMHIVNILNQLGANEHEKKQAVKHFEKNAVSHSAVADYITKLRTNDPNRIEEDFLQ
jgi:hydroxymethylglutaryl-CoA reductase